TAKSVSRTYPFTLYQLSLFNRRVLPIRQPCEKEPRVEPAWSKGRSHPSARPNHQVSLKCQVVFVEDLEKALGAIRQVPPLSCQFTGREALGAEGKQDARFLEELAHSAGAHR